MGKHVDKIKINQVVGDKKQNIQAEITKSKAIKELNDKVGNLEIVIEELTAKVNELTKKLSKSQNKNNAE